ncbi:hypothetical protein BCR36DRAFT_341033 [Piromyces finnis]|uniref:G-protein coupled receptors family 3 profile domain-containing protein n=1 Tax=Piromyces finnis TaxID=1754191 RepID=A0A1Y1VP87_9FUNG|nr:hypothetical protein BCR36DRAFT_341033 [Piromyces finnis]|eukprot:ORX60963.1 hypothetical protein BCR36DRAFT_341033 [Piromyces finnis]
MKIIGEQGEYELVLKLESFGKYQPFPDSEITVDIEIKKCDNSTHIYQDNLNIGLRSCYLPTCFQNCNTGKCINDDLCDCSNTGYTGKYCNEHNKHIKNKILYVFYNMLIFIFITISFASMYLMNINKNFDIIKAGSIEFSFIILIGTIFNYSGTLFEINSKGNIECLLSIIFKQLGFTLTYGTLLIKNFRIYKIFLNDNCYEIVMTRTKMYGFLFLLIFLDATFIMYWKLTDNIGIISSLNDKNQLYKSCNILRTGFIR